jgi:hypothetical protein
MKSQSETATASVLKGLAMNFPQSARPRVNGNSRILQRHSAKERLAILGAKDNLRYRLGPDEAHPRKTVFHFHGPAIRQFVNPLSFRLDARCFETTGRRRAIDSARIHQKFRAISLPPAAQTFQLRCDVRVSHTRSLAQCEVANNSRQAK